MADFRDALAAQLVGQGFRQSPTWGQGLANTGQMLVGALLSKQAEDRKKADTSTMFKALSAYQGGKSEEALAFLKSMHDPERASRLATALMKPTEYGAPVEGVNAEGIPTWYRFGPQSGQRRVVEGAFPKPPAKKPYLADGTLVWGTPGQAEAGGWTPYSKATHKKAIDTSVRGEKPTIVYKTVDQINASGGRYVPWSPGFKLDVTGGDDGYNIALDTGGMGSGDGKGGDAVLNRSLKKGILSDQDTLDKINYVSELYEPEFLSRKGAARATFMTEWNRWNPEKRDQFTARRAVFISLTNQSFIAYRKWATGVAGSEKEMNEIKRATFSEDDSPQDFEAKIRSIKAMTVKLMARKRRALAAGIDPMPGGTEWKKYIKENPLLDIEERGDQLQNLGYTDDQVLNILREEGYQ